MSDTVWSYRDTSWSQDSDLVGYDVEASDGSIGKIDEEIAIIEEGLSRLKAESGESGTTRPI